MRILYDHQVFSLQNAGGASRYFYELMKFLGTVPDVETEFLLGVNGTVYPFQSLDSTRVRVSSFGEWLPPGTLRYLANEAWSNLAVPFYGQMDVYHPTTYLRMPMVRSRRVVATHHDCTHERYPNFFPDARKIFWARKRLFPSVDAIICVSEACRQDLLRFYNVDPAKTRVIHHGISRLPRSLEAAEQLRRQVHRDYILYVGMRAAFKNFSGTLQAFSDSKLQDGFDLLALGGGALTAEEETLVATLGLKGSVICMPKVADPLLAEAYAGASLFVYPSFNEGFGFPPVEAMSVGCPVLASNIPAVAEVCHDAPFYFDPEDQGAFQRELLRAVNDEGARQRARKRGTEVAAQYSWQRCGQETLDLYRQCT